MKIIYIDDLDLEPLMPYRSLRGSKVGSDSSFIADSPRVVDKLLKSGLEFKSLLSKEEYFKSRKKEIQEAKVPVVYIAKKEILEQIVGHKIHHSVMAHIKRPKDTPLNEFPDNIVMVTRLNNQENIGAIARSSAIFGVGGYIVPSSGAHPFSRRAIRVSTGYAIYLKVHTYSNIYETIRGLKALGYTVIGSEASNKAILLSEYKDVPKRWVLILGNEEEGISEDVLELCDIVLKVEMLEGMESLNVATSGAIVMHYLKYIAKSL